MAIGLVRRAGQGRGQAGASAGQACRDRFGVRVWRVADDAAQAADSGLQYGGSAFAALGVGAQHGQERGLLGRQGLDLAAPVALSALGRQQPLAGQDRETADAGDLGLTVGQHFRAALQLGSHGAHQDRGPHRVHGLVGGDQQRRRRAAAHHLQGGQQPALHPPFARQAGDEGGVLTAQLGEAGALGVELDIVGALGLSKDGQTALEAGQFGLGVDRVGAQAAGTDLFVTIFGLEPGQVGVRIPVLGAQARGRAGRHGDETEEGENLAHQSR